MRSFQTLLHPLLCLILQSACSRPSAYFQPATAQFVGRAVHARPPARTSNNLMVSIDSEDWTDPFKLQFSQVHRQPDGYNLERENNPEENKATRLLTNTAMVNAKSGAAPSSVKADKSPKFSTGNQNLTRLALPR